MDNKFDLSTLKQYETILGKDKMASLFKDYLNEHREYEAKSSVLLEKNDLENLRIIYHSLCFASLVFGMKHFALACSKIEQDILTEFSSNEIKDDIAKSKKIFDNEISMVKDYLGIL
ncbi:MAG: hypothetical protein ACK5N8_00115 [Alphaproteobacteria bacterium]